MFCRGIALSEESRSPGPSFPAQPADLANCVSRICFALMPFLPSIFFCACWRWGGRFIGMIAGHTEAAVEQSAGTHDQNRGTDVAANAAGRKDFNTGFGFNVAEDLPVNYDFACFDVSVHH